MPTDESIAELRVVRRLRVVYFDGVNAKVESRTDEENDKDLGISDDILTQSNGKFSKRKIFSRLNDTEPSVNCYNLVKRVKDKQLSSSSSSLIYPVERVDGKVFS